jgi:DHA3 family macrolide efflux protein-like MFS transporter
MIVQYALIWYLTDTSKSASMLAFSTLVAFLPGMLIAPFIGPLIDRINKKILLIVADWLVAACAIALAIISGGGNLPYWLILLAMFIRAVAGVIQGPTTDSIIPTMVPEEFVPKVSGLNGTMSSISMLVTPAIGAFFYATTPISLIMLIDVIGAILGTIAVLLTHIVSFDHLPNENSYLQDIKDGVTDLKNRKDISTIILLICILNVLCMPIFSLFPLITTQLFGGTIGDASIVEFTWAVGSLIGGALVGLFGTTSKRITKSFWSGILSGIFFVLMGLLPATRIGLYIFIVMQIPAGVGFMIQNGMIRSIYQQAFPAEKIGKIMSLNSVATSAASMLGIMFTGIIEKTIGMGLMLVMAGVGTVVISVLLILLPNIKALDHMEIMTNHGQLHEVGQ